MLVLICAVRVFSVGSLDFLCKRVKFFGLIEIANQVNYTSKKYQVGINLQKCTKFKLF
jgi:hypothetical protein